LKVTAIDKVLLNLGQRLSVFDHYRGGEDDNDDDGIDDDGNNSNNWDLINATIAENEGNEWFIPNDKVYNAWTDLVYLTIGEISLRDFALERKFFNMRHERVEEYRRKWEDARDRNDRDYLSKHVCPGLANSFWDNWTKEEMEYYSNSERFPILKSKDNDGKEHIPM
jgi:hypothetical protein